MTRLADIGADYLDTRDLAEYASDLEDSGDDPDTLAAIVAAFEELGIDRDNPDWHYGPTLIHDRYFEDYAEELAADIGAIDRDASWPLNRIDWEAAADDLKMDYTSVEIMGHDYWIR